jgi:hypothetical protein
VQHQKKQSCVDITPATINVSLIVVKSISVFS